VDPNAAALVSGEGVRLDLAPAGVGSRVIAALIDLFVQGGILTALLLIDAPFLGSGDSAAAAAVGVSELVLVLAGYPIIMEWLTRGRTVGKIALGLRVVRDDGGPIRFGAALVRGLAGLILEKPGLFFPLSTLAGVITISSSAREKRIGDMMAGTVVLNERSAAAAEPGWVPGWVPVPLQPWTLALDLHRFDDRLALTTRQFVTRAYQMTPAAQAALGEDLRARVLAVTAPPPPPGTPTPTLLMSVLAERRRRATHPVAPPPPAFSPPPSGPVSGPSGGSGPFAPPV
jgi:uncharacterized RDD family membrane protein YckC